MPFFILFIVIPLMELMVFATVGKQIGLVSTLLLALLTAIIGGSVVRHQGVQTLAAVQDAMRRGKVPAGELFDGLCLVAAGAMLITPGFITDSLGFLLLVPAFRVAVRHIIANHTKWAVHVDQGAGFTPPPPQYQARPRDPDVIEGEFEHIDDDKMGN